jgi:hypothetical protein
MIKKFGLTLCLIPLVGVAGAASSVTYNFNSSSDGDLFTGGGVSGWSQNIENPTAFGETFELAYVSATNFAGGLSNAGEVGSFRANDATNRDTVLTGDLSSLAAGGQPGASTIYNMVGVSFDLGILDDSSDQFTGRDGFSVALTAANGDQAATVGFTPTVGNNDTWDVSVGVNGQASTATAYVVAANAGYKFYINSKDGTTDFSIGTSGGSVSESEILGSIFSPFYDGFRTSLNSVTGIAFTHDPLADPGTSANAITFDNISVQVPEPSSSLLMVLSAGLIAIRRRR